MERFLQNNSLHIESEAGGVDFDEIWPTINFPQRFNKIWILYKYKLFEIFAWRIGACDSQHDGNAKRDQWHR